MTRRALWLKCLVPALMLVVACGGESKESTSTAAVASTYPLTITQSDNQVLTIPQQPQRIVSLASHATEIFCAVGAESQLVAVERFANCPLGSSAKPQLDGFRPNLEAIAGYRPDLVYVSSDSGEVVQGLRRLGIPVLYLKVPTTLNGVLEHVQLLGSAAGHANEAGALAESMKRRLDGVKSRLASVSQGPRVYHELDTTYFSAAPNSFVGDFYTYLKAQNIAAGSATDYPQLSAEVIVQRNPEVIVLADEAAGITAATVKARPGWSAIDAVKNDRICVVDPDIVSRPGPRIVDALDALARCLYPDRFK